SDVCSSDLKWQPAFDYDNDGCYPTPAIGPDGTPAEGLKTSGSLNGNCHDQSDLDNTNSYARAKCDPSGWCAHMYALYFEKDQTVHGCCGHRHDLEHVVVWVKDGRAEYVSASAHGDYDTRPADEVLWEGTHAKIVYHKDGASTRAFRFAADHDDPPENLYGDWRYPDLVSWDHFPPGVQEAFAAADYGSATLDLKDGVFEGALAKPRPDGVEPDAEERPGRGPHGGTPRADPGRGPSADPRRRRARDRGPKRPEPGTDGEGRPAATVSAGQAPLLQPLPG